MSVLTTAIPCTNLNINSLHTGSPMAKPFCNILRRGPVVASQTKIVGLFSFLFNFQVGGPTPFWVSTYTSFLLYKVQDPFSACRQSRGQNSFSFQFLRKDQSLLHRSRNSGRECAWWTNSLVGQYLHQLSLVKSSRSIQHMQTVPWPKQFFF